MKNNKIAKGDIFYIDNSEWIALENENNLGCTCKCTFSQGGFKIGELYYFNSTMFILKFGNHPKKVNL